MGIHSRGGCRRQASEQYFTSAQFLAHRLRQVIGRPQVAQGLLGRERLLPLNEGVAGIMHYCSGAAAGLGSRAGRRPRKTPLPAIAEGTTTEFWRAQKREKTAVYGEDCVRPTERGFGLSVS
jgi:hypothetical protein